VSCKAVERRTSCSKNTTLSINAAMPHRARKLLRLRHPRPTAQVHTENRLHVRDALVAQDYALCLLLSALTFKHNIVRRT
jgi:hypothetical protein